MEKRKSLKERMAERRELMSRETGQGFAPTEDDKTQMTLFLEAVDRMCELLEKENSAIKSGSLDVVTELYEMKKEGLGVIESKATIIDTFLKSKSFPDAEPKIKRLNELVHENGKLLERMSSAASSIASQIKKIRDKHTLDGIYEKTGKKMSESQKYSSKLDQKL